MGNGPSGVYTLNYSANSAGQKLTIQWRLFFANRPDGNVTIQAATLSAPGADNPPFAMITEPADNSNFPLGAPISIKASAVDYDAAVAKVEFLDGTNKIGERLSSPYSITWNDASAGLHVLTARATDNAGGARSSAPVEIFVYSGGGVLNGSVAIPDSDVNLTSEGTVDWTHWGLLTTNSLDRKYGVAAKISNFVHLGAYPVSRFTNNPTAYSWNDGNPTPSVVSSPTGVFSTGYTNGFEISLPADTVIRRLKVYVGLYGAVGEFHAFLSDGSAPMYSDKSLDSIYDDINRVYTIDFAAASLGEQLIVRYRADALYDYLYGNVTLQSATLSGGNLPPTVTITSPAEGQNFPVNSDITISADASDPGGSVTNVEFFASGIRVGQDPASPFSIIWHRVAQGEYFLSARATDNEGDTYNSKAIRITVGTVTTNPVVLTHPVLSGGDMNFSFQTQFGHNYTVQYSTSLQPGSWQFLKTISGDGSVATVIESAIADAQRFYRVSVQ